jgi:uncharacterized protein YqjF (DUF2071 family)
VRRPAEILSFTDHRPWKLPSGSWLMVQGWYNLLFAHWSVPKESLRLLVPEPLALDTYEGSAWVGITPFDLRLRPRGLPVLSHFPELNCRTYVLYGDKPGIFFFSLDAGSWPAVWGARTLFRLPYFHAKTKVRTCNGLVNYSSHREGTPASFVAAYGSEGPVYRAQPGSLEHWLTERYCLYTYSHKRLFRGDIHHLPWPLQQASGEIAENTLATANGIRLPSTEPLLHFSRELDVLIWPLRVAD